MSFRLRLGLHAGRGLYATALLGATAAALLGAAFAAQGVQIEGRVTERCGAPLPGVSVTVNSESFRAATFTDEKGRFAFTGLVAGTYSVTATLDGFQPAGPRDVRVIHESPEPVEFTLGVELVTAIGRVGVPVSAAYGMSAAVVHLRIVETLGVQLAGRPLSEHRALVISAAKPFVPQPDISPRRAMPPLVPVVAGRVISILEHGAGTIRYGDAVVTGNAPARPGEEYVAFLSDECFDQWSALVFLPVRGGRVVVQGPHNGSLEAWNGYDGLPVEAFFTELRTFAGRRR